MTPAFGRQPAPAGFTLEAGMVLLVFTDLVNPAKVKYLIVASISPDRSKVGLVIVSTHQNPFASKNPEIAARQWVLRADDRHIVMYNSFADCAQVKVRPYDEVQGWLSTPRVLRGRLSGKELHKVLELLRTAPTITPATKRDLGLI
ncbi:hypothetical protein LJ737_04240 [Hymenobacter sp. 15J16-1T3B]|uniref:hypothetical protein n=1 Tax=Hymenobacter sp. 15J16-1T3B TaxID=2886941 RepID=UPI001D10709D|nr:hypothetical protein [Hymenobacter sp. 15J16-1T3B]MCC3156432.1 hypothetical protein [Hymenobacter sp. 15J16-1T3B]